jgi:hypothetical protein
VPHRYHDSLLPRSLIAPDLLVRIAWSCDCKCGETSLQFDASIVLAHIHASHTGRLHTALWARRHLRELQLTSALARGSPIRVLGPLAAACCKGQYGSPHIDAVHQATGNAPMTSQSANFRRLPWAHPPTTRTAQQKWRWTSARHPACPHCCLTASVMMSTSRWCAGLKPDVRA